MRSPCASPTASDSRPMRCSADPRAGVAVLLALLVATTWPGDDTGALDAAAFAPIARFRVDLATADAATLALLPGIGPTRAHAMIEHRTARGPWRSAADLTAVHGLGPRLAARIAPHCTFDTSRSDRR